MNFSLWLYQHYIKNYLESCSREGYEQPLSLMETDLDFEQRQIYAKAIEFWATRAFFLGVRTGAGLSKQL